MEPNGRQRWTEGRRKKDPNLYDEWLKEERVAQRQQEQQQETQQSAENTPTPPASSTSLPLRRGDTTATLRESAGTIRAVTPDDAVQSDVSQEDSPLPERGTTSFERAFIPYITGQLGSFGTTTTITGGPAAHATSASLSTSSPPSSLASSKARRLVREREWERDVRTTQTGGSPPSSRNGAVGAVAGARPAGMLARSSSRNNGHNVAPVVAATSARDAVQGLGNTVRPRTRTLEETRRRERSPTALLKNRNRIGSVHTPSSPIYQGAEYLASVPAATSPPSAPSITSLGSPVQDPTTEVAGRRSISPMSSNTAESMTSGLPPQSARRIVHLMKTLNGRMSGNLVFRRGETSPWSQIYCYVKEDTGSLMYESRASESSHRTLVSDLRGCSVRPSAEDNTPFLEVSIPHTASKFHLKLLTQADFDAWYATFLHWSARDMVPETRSSHGNGPLSTLR